MPARGGTLPLYSTARSAGSHWLGDRMNRPEFDAQFTMTRAQYLGNLDMVTWLRHFYVLRELIEIGRGDVLEIGTGDGVVRRCAEPLVASYKVLDVNPQLDPDYHADIRTGDNRLVGQFDTIIITEVMEHLPFGDMPATLRNLWAWLRPGGRIIVSLPHRKSSVSVLTPNQKLRTVRFPNGSISLSEAYNRFIRRRIWIDPNHQWEIGDGKVSRPDVEARFSAAGFVQQKRLELPYSDYWVLTKPNPGSVP